LSESESNLLQKICSWKRKIVIIVNKLDIIRDSQEKAILMQYVSQNAAKIIGIRGDIEPIPVFGVSGRQALEAHIGSAGSGSRMQHLLDSNIDKVERFLLDKLSHENIIRDKLHNPIRMMERLVELINDRLVNKSIEISTDRKIIEFINESTASYSANTKRDALNHSPSLKRILDYMVIQLQEFLENKARLVDIFTFIDEKMLAERVKEDIVVSLETVISDINNDITKLLCNNTQHQEGRVREYIGDHTKKYGFSLSSPQSIAGKSDGKDILLRIRENFTDIFYDYSREKEAINIAKALSNSSKQVAAFFGISFSLTTASALGSLFQGPLIHSFEVPVAVGISALFAVGGSIYWRNSKSIIR
jgi:hypothetical protein